MDGTDLLLDPFRQVMSTPDDPNRIIAVNYPFNQSLTIPELVTFVTHNYLAPLSEDPRGYILLSQSFSGHVGLHLSQMRTPGNLRAQIFVNAFASPPGPSLLRGNPIPAPVTDALFRRQPPPWLVGRMFLGENTTGMHVVQAAASRVAPNVMSQRLSLCLSENSWHVWRRRDVLQASRTLYLRGVDDAIVSRREAREMQLARPDVEWVEIPRGPHLLLQSFGTECGIAVDLFCERVCGESGVAAD